MVAIEKIILTEEEALGQNVEFEGNSDFIYSLPCSLFKSAGP
jgi:hypothetical protein